MVIPVVTHHKHDIDVDKEGEDRISQLPDDVLALIVSRLFTTTDAVRTSVLSKRWKHVYTFVSEVKFFCNRMPGVDSCSKLRGEKLGEFQRKFVQAVDTFLQHHSVSRITSFELNCCFRGCISDSFRRWTNSVGRLGVERLKLGYCSPKESSHIVFSSDFLPESPSLKHLSFRGDSLQISIQKALKDLELFDVALTSEAVDCILLNCCSLQSLRFIICRLPLKLHIHGPDLQLKNLTVYRGCSRQVVEIELSAINLTTFEFCTLGMLKLTFSSVPSLQNLFANFCDRKMLAHVFGKVAKDLPHLKCMYVGTDTRFFEAFEIGGANKFSNLRQLALSLLGINKLDLVALATILDACPFLHKFYLSMGFQSTFNGESQNRVARLHTRLKEVEFSGFKGTKNEFNFIYYILKNVVFLERLSIFLASRSYDVLSGSWRWPRTYLNLMDTKKKRRNIRDRLQEQTLSNNVDIIIV